MLPRSMLLLFGLQLKGCVRIGLRALRTKFGIFALIILTGIVAISLDESSIVKIDANGFLGLGVRVYAVCVGFVFSFCLALTLFSKSEIDYLLVGPFSPRDLFFYKFLQWVAIGVPGGAILAAALVMEEAGTLRVVIVGALALTVFLSSVSAIALVVFRWVPRLVYGVCAAVGLASFLIGCDIFLTFAFEAWRWSTPVSLMGVPSFTRNILEPFQLLAVTIFSSAAPERAAVITALYAVSISLVSFVWKFGSIDVPAAFEKSVLRQMGRKMASVGEFDFPFWRGPAVSVGLPILGHFDQPIVWKQLQQVINIRYRSLIIFSGVIFIAFWLLHHAPGGADGVRGILARLLGVSLGSFVPLNIFFRGLDLRVDAKVMERLMVLPVSPTRLVISHFIALPIMISLMIGSAIFFMASVYGLIGFPDATYLKLAIIEIFPLCLFMSVSWNLIGLFLPATGWADSKNEVANLLIHFIGLTVMLAVVGLVHVLAYGASKGSVPAMFIWAAGIFLICAAVELALCVVAFKNLRFEFVR